MYLKKSPSDTEIQKSSCFIGFFSGFQAQNDKNGKIAK